MNIFKKLFNKKNIHTYNSENENDLYGEPEIECKEVKELDKFISYSEFDIEQYRKDINQKLSN